MMIRTDIDPQKIKIMYVDKGMSLRKISLHFDTSYRMIVSRLKKMGVEMRPNHFRTDLDSKEIKQLYLSGKTAKEIGLMFNIGESAIQRRLKKENVTMRPANHLCRGGPQRHEPAIGAVRKAIHSGKLKRPDSCEECSKTPPKFSDGRSPIHAHHPDYNKYLDVMWLCSSCHKEWHRHNQAIPFKKVANE